LVRGLGPAKARPRFRVRGASWGRFRNFLFLGNQNSPNLVAAAGPQWWCEPSLLSLVWPDPDDPDPDDPV